MRQDLQLSTAEMCIFSLPLQMSQAYYLIYKSMMKASVNPVDQYVSEEEKGQDTSNELKPAYKRQKDMAESRFSSQDQFTFSPLLNVFFNFLLCIGLQPINNVVIVSGEQ